MHASNTKVMLYQIYLGSCQVNNVSNQWWFWRGTSKKHEGKSFSWLIITSIDSKRVLPSGKENSPGSRCNSNMDGRRSTTILNTTGPNGGKGQRAISIKKGLARIPKTKMYLQVCCILGVDTLHWIRYHCILLCWRSLERIPSQGSEHQGVQEETRVHGPSNCYPVVINFFEMF